MGLVAYTTFIWCYRNLFSRPADEFTCAGLAESPTIILNFAAQPGLTKKSRLGAAYNDLLAGTPLITLEWHRENRWPNGLQSLREFNNQMGNFMRVSFPRGAWHLQKHRSARSGFLTKSELPGHDFVVHALSLLLQISLAKLSSPMVPQNLTMSKLHFFG